MEESDFLIENCDASQRIAKYLECSHDNSMMALFQIVLAIILEDPPDSLFRFEDAFDLSDHLENIYDFIARII